MATEKSESKSPTESADWRVIDDWIRRAEPPRELTDALKRIRDPEARAKADEELKAEQERTAKAAKEAEDKAAKDKAAAESGAKPAARPR